MLKEPREMVEAVHAEYLGGLLGNVHPEDAQHITSGTITALTGLIRSKLTSDTVVGLRGGLAVHRSTKRVREPHGHDGS